MAVSESRSAHVLSPRFCRANLALRILGQVRSANFDGEFFSANLSALFFRLVFPGFQGPPPPPKKKFTSKIHAQNCRHSSPVSLSRTQFFFTPIFCFRRSTFSSSEIYRFCFHGMKYQSCPNETSPHLRQPNCTFWFLV